MDLLAFERVDAVAGPDPVRPFQDAQIDPPAAAGTRLDLEPRVRSTELVEEPVHRHGVAVHPRRAVRGVAGVVQVPVVIPLQVADVVGLQQSIEAAEDVVVGAGMSQIQDVLVPRGQTDPATGAEDPLGVGPGQIGVQIDHLWFDPEPELHPESPDVVDQRSESIRPDVGGDVPVSEAAGVVAPPGEPAVVEDEPFDPDLRGPVGELLQSGQVVVEVHRLPGVHQDRPRR